MKKQVVIIGGSGFIGRNLAKYLSEQNFKVKILDKYVDDLNDSFILENKIEIGHSDVTDVNSIVNHLGDIENIIWLVHTSVPSNSMINLSNDLISNIEPLINFLTRIKDNPNLEKFIYLSSGGTVYGNPEAPCPIKENSSINPISNYGLTKYIAEQYIKLILQNTTISSYILRPSNVYGPFQNLSKPQGIIGHAFKAAINNHQLFLYNNGDIVRDFIHVNDLSDALLRCLKDNRKLSTFNTYNIGSSEAISMKKIIELVSEITKLQIDIVNKPQRDFDCNYNVLDCSKFKEDFFWNTKVSIEDGLNSVWEWIKLEYNN